MICKIQRWYPTEKVGFRLEKYLFMKLFKPPQPDLQKYLSIFKNNYSAN